MCGVFGVIRPSGISEDDWAVFGELGRQLKHRGPDGDGQITTPQSLLGMHRLSIIDLDHGWQPFWSEDQTIGVLGNGEIYNARKLREGLLLRGHVLRTNSDIEVVAHLYEEQGLECVQSLRGMFALVVLDKGSAEVVLIRDRLGEKPLIYSSVGGALVFASEQRALIRGASLPVVLDGEVTAQYLLHGFVPEPLSLIRGIRKVPAAHALRVSLVDGATQLVQYWNALDYLGDNLVSADEIAAAVEDAVKATLVSDVSVGIALSAGLDSSMIASIASRERADVRAFTIAYSETGFDESETARSFAEELGLPCSVTVLDTSTIARDFAKVCGMRDEPISDIAGPALAALPMAARESGVPVLMTGVGGDELFWGYEWIRHLATWCTSYLDPDSHEGPIKRMGITPPPSTLQGVAAWAGNGFGVRTERDLRKFMQQWTTEDSVPLPFYEFQYGYPRILKQIKALVAPGDSYPHPEFWGFPTSQTKAGEYTSFSNDSYLRVNSLTQMDRLAMHYSVESRTPFADHRLIELVMSGRLTDLTLNQPTKSQQREVARALLPAEVLNRKKRGFTPPVREWTRAIWQANQDAKTGDAILRSGDVDPTALQRGLRSPIDRIGRVDQMALRLMTLELWLRSVSDTEPSGMSDRSLD